MTGRTAPGRRGGRQVAAAAIVLALLAALSACGTATGTGAGPASPGSATTPASARPAASSAGVPPPPSGTGQGGAGFRVLSLSFVSGARGFALGTTACGRSRCVGLLATADGGRTWRALTPPARAAASYGLCDHGSVCVQQIGFATAAIGYAFDPSLFLTTDGGRHWRRLPGAGVSSLAAAGGTAVRVSSPVAGCSGEPYQVQSAAVGTTAWAVLAAPVIEMICAPVLYRQGGRLVLVGYGNAAGGVRATAMIDRSADGGRTWASGPDRCGRRDGYASAIALARPDVLVLLCRHQQMNASGRYGPAWIRVSTDGGATFGPDETVPTVASAQRGSMLSYQVAAASADRVLVTQTGVASTQVLVTQDGGLRWSVTLRAAGAGTGPGPGTAGLVVAGFSGPLTARIAQAGTIWTTTDGGRTWRADPLRAG